MNYKNPDNMSERELRQEAKTLRTKHTFKVKAMILKINMAIEKAERQLYGR